MNHIWVKKLSSVLFCCLLMNCGGQTTESQASNSNNARDGDALVIWWSQNYYPQEEEALNPIIEAWEDQTGKQVELVLVSQDDILRQAENALKAGNPPDILYADRAEETLIPQWAWQGQLLDVSEVVEVNQERYTKAALKSAQLYNAELKERTIYAVPIQQQSMHVHYWQDLLEEAGFTAADIPRTWDEFWLFWRQVQDNLRDRGQETIYGLALPMSAEAGDTYSAFEQILEAYDVQLFDADGELQLRDPQVRQSLIDALTWYVQFYQDGYVPSGAENWTNSDNNTVLLNREAVMTINPTLAIPVSQREDDQVYREQLVTIDLPSEPDGEPLTYVVSVRQAVVFATSAQPDLAKEFLTYFTQPDVLGRYIEGMAGRYFPVMPETIQKPFWNNPDDPHISAATQQFAADKNRSNYQIVTPAYAGVQVKNIWGQAIERVAVDGVSPAVAIDDAIAQIETIFQEWQQQ